MCHPVELTLQLAFLNQVHFSPLTQLLYAILLILGLGRPRGRQEGVGQRGGGRRLLVLPLPHDVRAGHALRHDDPDQLVRVSTAFRIMNFSIQGVLFGHIPSVLGWVDLFPTFSP